MSEGRIEINGFVVTDLATTVDPLNDVVSLDGRTIRPATQHSYVLLYKPPGVVSTTDDPQGRPTVTEMVSTSARLSPVGRLDLDSEGLILLTDDGEVAQRLTHPSFEHVKRYRVWLDTSLAEEAIRTLREGVVIDDERTLPAEIDVLRRTDRSTVLLVGLRQGRKRQIRLMAEAVDARVQRLIRESIGPLTLKGLSSGESRTLEPSEVASLRSILGLD